MYITSENILQALTLALGLVIPFGLVLNGVHIKFSV